ncbi:hypothetical protein [Streptomyces albiflavescens]|uniref:hypothetical protein n=1 Tax=Streptomyces albiflavescens TaxID=1623582 RepID=UPI001663A5E4|nr:hypothetical protein [Streptomyces albiflavescens]
MATYYGAAVSKDRLEQSREATQRESRSQASHVSFWSEGGPHRAQRTVHVMNRSPDPITGITLSLLLVTQQRGEDPAVLEPFQLTFPNLGPCKEMVLTEETLLSALDVSQQRPSEVQLSILNFTDGDGRTWRRADDGLEESRQIGEPDFPGTSEVTLDAPPAPKRAAMCDGGTT